MAEAPASCHKEFVSEPVIPVAGSFDTSSMTTGEPGLPARFAWRGAEYEIEAWRSGRRPAHAGTAAANNTSAGTGSEWKRRTNA